MAEEVDVNERYGVGPVRCRWLPGDEAKARWAEVVRIIQMGHWWYEDESQSMENVGWQPGVLWKVNEFVSREAPRVKVIVSPAGMVTVDMEEPPCQNASDLGQYLGAPQGRFRMALQELEGLGCLGHEMLLGMDVCLAKTAPLQTVVHVAGETDISFRNTTAKLYPPREEADYLVGWQICHAEQCVPTELATARCVQTQAGPILVLVCYDARLLRGPTSSPVTHGGWIARMVRQHFWEVATGGLPPRYVLVATHWHRHRHTRNRRSGTPGFIEAAEYLARQLSQATIVTTMFAPQVDQVALARDSFPVLGCEPHTVATLLVEDEDLPRRMC